MGELKRGERRLLPDREVARPVANLGNTCYMNAVLQALAHAPELCMAMDVEPHCPTCPIYLGMASKRRSPSSSPEFGGGTRKSRRRNSGKAPRSSPTNSEGEESVGGEKEEELPFCALCEVEQHLQRVHDTSSSTAMVPSADSTSSSQPVAPSLFVNGFLNHVAPWFKLGQQEDSHEFLRLLIDAMQRSCQQARSASTIEAAAANPQDTPPEQPASTSDEEDQEYPFQLFRGMVESNVTCESCKSTSSTLDPIEDIGLDVTPVGASSKSPPTELVDVGTALARFARAEALDAGYKCEKCGKVGRATKQSKLASIPPILTLHLKRFRYGAETQAKAAQPRRSREVSQLVGGQGKSGSAKIEGHCKFGQILDLKPYLTPAMQEQHTTMLARLFAVIVHAGKNSHSGHYIAYCRNVQKNEWWKMDDARVTLASLKEVQTAEAYMLFYRVVEHPFAMHLRQQVAKKFETKSDNAPDAAVVPHQQQAGELAKLLSHVIPKKQQGQDHVALRTRKRKAPDYTNGEDWARACTSLPEPWIAKFKDIEAAISEYVQFKPEFFKMLTEHASRPNAKLGQGPSSGVCDEDVVDGTGGIKRALLHVFCELNKHARNHGVTSLFKKQATNNNNKAANSKSTGAVSVQAAAMVDANEESLL